MSETGSGERGRVWEAYLSDRDREHLTRLGPPPKVGFGTTPALLLIDNYKAGLGEEPLPLLESIEHYPLSMGLEAWAAVARIKHLLALCRQLDVLVVHTTMLSAPNSPWDFYTNLRLSPTSRSRHEVANRVNPDGSNDVWELSEELLPVGGEIVIRKTAPSAFWGTPLVAVLQANGIDTLLVCGNSTSGCVRATVVDGASQCLHVIVVEECVYDRTEAAHAINLFDMDQKYADVVGVDAVSAWLHARVSDSDRSNERCPR